MPIGHICYSAKPTCYAVMWSYGEICCHCGCCSHDSLKRAKARMDYHKEWLEYWMHRKPNYTGEDATLRDFLLKNIAEHIEQESKKYHYYESRVKALEAKKKEAKK